MTVKELLEGAGIKYTKRIASQIGQLISQKAKAKRIPFTQKQEFINVSDYPEDFVPEMEKIAIKYFTPKTPEQVRVGKFVEPLTIRIWVPFPSNMVEHVYSNAPSLDIQVGERQPINDKLVGLELTMSSYYSLFALGACCNIDMTPVELPIDLLTKK